MPSSALLPAVLGKAAVGAETVRGLLQGSFTSICGAEQLCRMSSVCWQLHSPSCACSARPRAVPGLTVSPSHQMPSVLCVCHPPTGTSSRAPPAGSQAGATPDQTRVSPQLVPAPLC